MDLETRRQKFKFSS